MKDRTIRPGDPGGARPVQTMPTDETTAPAALPDWLVAACAHPNLPGGGSGHAIAAFIWPHIAANVRVAPSHPSPGESAGFDAEVARVAAFLHDEYGCRITCRGGRLADDRHPSHNEAYRDQAERLVAAIGDEHE